MSDGQIWLGDKLPSFYSASLHIKFLSPSPNTAERASVVYHYSNALFEQWEKSFTSKFVVSLSSVQRTVDCICSEYDAFIKKNRQNTPKGIRQINKEWRLHCCIYGNDMLPKEKKGRPSKKRKTADDHASDPKYDTLLDIGRNQGSLTGPEQLFYQDQCGLREQSLSEEIDWEFEVEWQAVLRGTENQIDDHAANVTFAEAPEYEEELSLNCSREERHLRREMLLEKNAALCSASTQTDGNFPESQPEICGIRNCHASVKDAICTASIRSAISIPKALLFLHIISKFQLKSIKTHGGDRKMCF